jgi:peroxiredoxin
MLRNTRYSQVLVLVTIFLITLAAGCGGGDEAPTAEAGSEAGTVAESGGRVGAAKGDLAPDFTLKRLDGTALTLSDLRGKAVIVDFWDTWCPPCRRALPHLEELSQTYRDDLVVVGVAFGQEGEAKVRSYVQERGLTFEMVLYDPESTILSDFGGIQSIPTTFLIDAQGVIREKWVGAADKASYENAVVAAVTP